MPIITDADLASYLEIPLTPNVTLKASLADGVVTELIYKTGVPATVPTRVKAITLEVGARAVRNSNGYSSETIDDYTYRRAEGTREAGVYVTDAERIELLGFVAARSGGSFYSVPLTSPLDVV